MTGAAIATVFVLATGTSGVSLSADAAADASLRERIDDLQASLDRSQAPARLWLFGWTSAFTAGLAVRSTLAVSAASEGIRIDSRVGALTLGTGLLATMALAPRSAFAAAKLRGLPDTTAEERRRKLLAGQELLAKCAFWERAGKSFVPHLVGVAVNVAAGLYLGIGEKRWASGLVAAVGGIAITELKIFTQPMTASAALAAYRGRGESGPVRASQGARPTAASEPTLITLTSWPLGLSLVGSF